MTDMIKFTVPWGADLHAELLSHSEDMKEWPNIPGRKFSILSVEGAFSGTVHSMMARFDMGLDMIRNFVIEPGTRLAVGAHKDSRSPCFALNVMLTGSMKVNIHDKAKCVPVKEDVPNGGGLRFHVFGSPTESLLVNAGDMFVMNTMKVHSVDSLGDETVLLASFVPSTQYSYEEAIRKLGL